MIAQLQLRLRSYRATPAQRWRRKPIWAAGRPGLIFLRRYRPHAAGRYMRIGIRLNLASSRYSIRQYFLQWNIRASYPDKYNRVVRGNLKSKNAATRSLFSPSSQTSSVRAARADAVPPHEPSFKDAGAGRRREPPRLRLIGQNVFLMTRPMILHKDGKTSPIGVIRPFVDFSRPSPNSPRIIRTSQVLDIPKPIRPSERIMTAIRESHHRVRLEVIALRSQAPITNRHATSAPARPQDGFVGPTLAPSSYRPMITQLAKQGPSGGLRSESAPPDNSRAKTGTPRTGQRVEVTSRWETVEKEINQKIVQQVERSVREQMERTVRTDTVLAQRLTREIQSELYRGIVVERERLGLR